MVWAAHEPPMLMELSNPKEWRPVAGVNPIAHAQTEEAGLVFQHFAYATLRQIQFKEQYYGYQDATARWLGLQAAETFPLALRTYFPWVGDDTMVDRAEFYTDPLIDLRPAGLWPANARRAKKPTVVIDSMFFQLDRNSGIARVWKSILSEWIKDGFAANLVIVDRLGLAPKFPGIRYRTAVGYGSIPPDADCRFLQRICDEENAHVFISTYYTSPEKTPSLFMVHDMIPEMAKLDLTFWRWKLKHQGIEKASAYVAVSENSKRDLLRVFPKISPEKVEVIYNGVDPAFHPRPQTDIEAFRRQRGLSKPYFLLINVSRIDYKNDILSFRALKLFKDAANFDLLCTTGSPLDAEYAAMLPKEMSVTTGWLNDDELALAYSGAAALIYPSVYEGFGLPVLEAMACGCPVITCKNSAIPEVAGDAAIYVSALEPAELAAAMGQILRPEIREPMIQRGLQRAKLFSWETAAMKLKEALLRVVQTGNS
jgi:glycosyltransferase involved in cell wall biosynthesis